MADDFYLSLLDWSPNNTLAVGLGPSIYLWNASSGSVSELCSLDNDDAVASLAWSQDGTHIAIGGHHGDVHLWDVESSTRVRSIKDQDARVGTASWNASVLSMGSTFGSIFNHDVRLAESRVGVWEGHSGNVCGLKWSPDGMQCASGGSDSLVNIWDARTTIAKYTKRDHTASVKVCLGLFSFLCLEWSD
jgi:cell division cycle protein 20 (cofactor of APC complex)